MARNDTGLSFRG